MSSSPWIIVGLGNPGEQYEATRHNVGQMVIDELAKRHNVKLSTHKSRTDIAAYKLGVGVDAFSVILAKSKSYMNESGGPIKALANFYSVEPKQIIVLHDELDIPFAAIRSKIAGFPSFAKAKRLRFGKQCRTNFAICLRTPRACA